MTEQQAEDLRRAALELAGAYWRLDNYGMIHAHADDDDAQRDCEHWRNIANEATQTIRMLATLTQPFCNGNGG